MALKHYAYRRLTDLFCDVIIPDDSNQGAINPEYTPTGVPGTLKECSWNGFGLSAETHVSADDIEFVMWPMVTEWVHNEATGDKEKVIVARFIYDESSLGGGNYVITIDEKDVDLGAYRCPVCGQDDVGFQTFPPTEFDMDKTGAMNVPAGMAVDPSFDDDVACNCKKCGFQGHKAAFDTGGWDEYKGRVE